MDGPSAKKSTSLEILVIQNITNINDLKAKLNDIIQSGEDYEYEVSSCLKTLLKSSDQEIVLLTVQAISELVKSEEKRDTYAQSDVIEPIISILEKEICCERTEFVKQCCRALGNLCCDCDAARTVILKSSGIPVLKKLIESTLHKVDAIYNEIKLLASKTMLNFAIGGEEFSESIVRGGIIDLLHKIFQLELEKDDMNDEIVSTALLILSVVNDNNPEFLFEEKVNKAVLDVLRETTNVNISELCLEHLHAQSEHESVKTLIANEGGLQLLCSRLEQLMSRRETGDVNAEDSDLEAIIKQACDLIVIVLTGDKAMHTLYNHGLGEVYQTVVRWLDSRNYHLLAAAVLAVGNFARQDDYCAQMMEDHIFDKLLDLFEVYHGFAVRMQREPEAIRPIEPATVTKIQHAVLAALRNLIVPQANKRVAAAQGRAAPLLLGALPRVESHHVAYKLLAALRMLVDGQEGVAMQLARDRSALAAVARWGHCGECAGAAGEAPRLLAWTAKQLRHQPHWTSLVQVEGCVSCLINMLVVCHSVMQNEAILALTLLAIESLKNPPPSEPNDYDYEKSFISQLIKSEIGKHVSVLIETNLAKMPIEVAENLLAFLDITSKKNNVAADYKEAKVHDSLKKFGEMREDFSEDLKTCLNGVVSAIASGKVE